MFRAECKAGTDLGKAACTIISKGGLVGDEIVNGIVASRISRSDCANGFLLDGYPRTVPQARYFSGLLRGRGLPEPVVVHLDVADEALVGRLTARRQCPKCHHIYNLQFQPPRVAGICDADGAELMTREDDREEVIRQRLKGYKDLTGPVLEWFKDHVVTIDGTQRPDKVTQEIEREIPTPAFA